MADTKCPIDGEELRPNCVSSLYCGYGSNGEFNCGLYKPAPLPLPADLICAEVFFSDVDQIGGFSAYAIKGMADKLFAHITAQAQRIAEVEAENGKLVLSIMEEQERTEHLSLRHLDAAARAEAAELQRDEANAAAHCNKAAFDEQSAQLLASEVRVVELEKERERHIHELAREIAWKDEHARKRKWAEEAFAKADAENEKLKAQLKLKRNFFAYRKKP